MDQSPYNSAQYYRHSYVYLTQLISPIGDVQIFISGKDAQAADVARKFKDAQSIDPTATEFLDFSTGGGGKLYGAVGIAPWFCALVTGRGGAIVGCYAAFGTDLGRARDRISDLYEKHRDSFEGGGDRVGAYLYKPLAVDGEDPSPAYEDAERVLVEILQDTTGSQPEVREYLWPKHPQWWNAEDFGRGGFLIENEGGGEAYSSITWINVFTGSSYPSQGGSSAAGGSQATFGNVRSNEEL